jgi:hypothetical protein
MAQKPKARGSKHVPPGQSMKHSDAFDAAMNDALQDADQKWGKDTTDATVQLEVNVETQSPGVIHEYRVILTPTQ